MDEKERDALAVAAGKVARFAQATLKLKQAKDRNGGAFLTAEDVDALIWGLQTLRGPDDADTGAAARRRRAAAGGR